MYIGIILSSEIKFLTQIEIEKANDKIVFVNVNGC